MTTNEPSHVGTAQTHIRESAAVILSSAEVCAASIQAAAELIASAFKTGGKLLLCGNGGSAADCQHTAAELTSRLSSDFVRPGLPAIALTTDTSFLTAYANDFDFEGVFARQVQAVGRPGDVLLGISTSGKSKNIILAAEQAKASGMKVVALTGAGERRGVSPPVRSLAGCPQPEDGGARLIKGESDEKDESGRMPLLQLADVAICVPSDNTQHIQEAHLVIEHILCHLIERAVFGEHGASDWGIRR